MLTSVFRTIELLRRCSLTVPVPQEWFHRSGSTESFGGPGFHPGVYGVEGPEIILHPVNKDMFSGDEVL